MSLARLLLTATLVGGAGMSCGDRFQTVAEGRAAGAWAVFSEAGSVEDGTQKLKIAVYTGKGGRLLWWRQVDGHFYPAGSGRQNFPGWGEVNCVLWVAHSRGGDMRTVDNSGYRLSDGRPLWNDVDVGYPLATGQGKILFRQMQSHLAYRDLRQENFIVHDLDTGSEVRLEMRIPMRANCGDINKYSYEDAAYLKLWADSQFFYARHKDACGVFVARFDWHGNETQIPTVPARVPAR